MALPEESEGNQREDADKSEDKGERFAEISEAKREAHQSGVSKIAGGKVPEQRSDAEEQERLQKRIRTHLAHAEFALGRDDEESNAEVAQRVAVEKERERVGRGRCRFA